MIWFILISIILFIWHCPIFKPYFGFKLKSWKDLGK